MILSDETYQIFGIFPGDKWSNIFFIFSPKPTAPNKMIESYSDFKWEEIEGVGTFPNYTEKIYLPRFHWEEKIFPPKLSE